MAQVIFTTRGTSLNMLAKNAKRLAAKEINVGVLQSAGSTDDGVSLAKLAVWHEYGSAGKYPARPFLRTAFDKNKAANERLAEQIADRVVNGQFSVSQGQNIIGNKMVADAQQVIGSSLLAPNHPKTIARKGSDAPLIDTGQLRQAISFEVK